ncbi:uncharacterized protein LOC110463025 isoform X2 [Mizuhopecten yessoensis]|uniref:uncharacterized protein LOC110463025 isoform X2 n=1 Tax=Mizuhopecten yessoensis TaxID=6573 RepID=UPI000B45CA7E|nr:uncharacterized protein LOC110463025 isoform X2 [Mizuhopecten yessoensis]
MSRSVRERRSKSRSRSRSVRERSMSRSVRERRSKSRSMSRSVRERSSRSRSRSIRERRSKSRSARDRFHIRSVGESPLPTQHTSTGRRSNADNKPQAFPMPEGRFQKRIMYLLTDIRTEIQKIANGCGSMAPSGTEANLPSTATSTENLHDLDNKLKTLEEKQNLTRQLANIAGQHLKDNIKKIMCRLMTNDVMSAFNMKGNKGKLSFESLNLYQVVKESALKTPTGKDATEHAVDMAIASCLKYAPDRRGGGGRPK